MHWSIVQQRRWSLFTGTVPSWMWHWAKPPTLNHHLPGGEANAMSWVGWVCGMFGVKIQIKLHKIYMIADQGVWSLGPVQFFLEKGKNWEDWWEVWAFKVGYTEISYRLWYFSDGVLDWFTISDPRIPKNSNDRQGGKNRTATMSYGNAPKAFWWKKGALCEWKWFSW